jgi:hypothetical protein
MVDDRDNVGLLFSFPVSGAAAETLLLNGSEETSFLSPDAGVNKDSVLACRDPEKTRCCGFLAGFAASFSNVDAFSGIGISPPKSVFDR